jgi:hypothetical protein
MTSRHFPTFLTMKMVQVSAYKMSEEDGVTLNDKDSETNF